MGASPTGAPSTVAVAGAPSTDLAAGAPSAGPVPGAPSAATPGPRGPRDTVGVVVFLLGIAASIPTSLISALIIRSLLNAPGEMGAEYLLARLVPFGTALAVTAVLVVGIWLMRTPVASRAWATGAVVGALVWGIGAAYVLSFFAGMALAQMEVETFRVFHLLSTGVIGLIEVSLVNGAWVLARRYRPILLLGAVVVAVAATVCSTAVSFLFLHSFAMYAGYLLGLVPTVVSVVIQLLGIGALALLARRVHR